ncbi:MAG: DUF4231 domain-containing protein [Mollicutes bacterium PWAP]|nr:DUF4231 domain-containing protein [Mollicutes bacterium PWAP]
MRLLKYKDPLETLESEKKRLEILNNKLKILNYVIAFLSFFLVLGGAVLTPIAVSKMVWPSYPTWYFFVISGISAFLGLIGGFLTFFSIRVKISNNKFIIKSLKREKIRFDEKLFEKYKTKNSNYWLLIEIHSIIGNKQAKELTNGKGTKLF